MKKNILYICTFLCIFVLNSCGYQIKNSENFPSKEVIPALSTINIGEIEQNSIHPWVPYLISTTIRDEVSLRNFATWKSTGTSDYSINANLYSFDIASFSEVYTGNDLISSADIDIELSIIDNKTNTMLISSGITRYSENFENPREEEAIRQVLIGAIRNAFDKLYIEF